MGCEIGEGHEIMPNWIESGRDDVQKWSESNR